MPLRVTKGIPIIPKPPASESGALVLGSPTPNEEALAEAAPPMPTSQDLKIAPVIQKQSQWCWAACVEMVLTHYQNHREQCAIVDEKRSINHSVNISLSPVCGNEDSFALEACNIQDVDDVWGRFHIHAALHDAPHDAPQSGQVDFPTIQGEIGQRRPVEVGIRWHEDLGGGHAVLIVGWTTVGGEDAVLVNDPLPTSLLGIGSKGQSGKLVLTELQLAFGHGTWSQTWTGLAPEDNHV
jgi:hypothetical protein